MAGTPRHNLRFDNKNNQFYKSFGTKVMESILAVKDSWILSAIFTVGLLKITKVSLIYETFYMQNENIFAHCSWS